MHSFPSSAKTPFHSLTSVGALMCLVGMVVLFSTIAPATKYIFQTSQLDPNVLASARVAVGFLCLLPIALATDARGLASLSWSNVMRLTGLGWLGVVSYAMAAWGLQYTSVSHYILIYSLVPTFTAVFSMGLRKQPVHPVTLLGVACSTVGCIVALSDTSPLSGWSVTFGNACTLLYTVMMAGYMAWSGGIAVKFGVMAANTVMFGTSLLVLVPVAFASDRPPTPVSLQAVGMVLYIGLATVAAFVLRYRVLRTIPPTTVATYHNLIPICTIMLAHVSLNEPLTLPLALGGLTILLGIELVRQAPDIPNTWPSWRIARRTLSVRARPSP